MVVPRVGDHCAYTCDNVYLYMVIIIKNPMTKDEVCNAEETLSPNLTNFLMKKCKLLEEVRKNVGFLRQWINEKPKDMLVTNENIEYWLFDVSFKTKESTGCNCSSSSCDIPGITAAGNCFKTEEDELRNKKPLIWKFEKAKS